jgi:hypothetical protein
MRALTVPPHFIGIRTLARTGIPLAAFGSLAAPAMAQQYDPFDSLGTLQANDNPLDKKSPDSVTERSRPEYSAVPIRLGSLEVMPQVLVNVDLDDNVYAVEDNRTADQIVTVRPRLSIGRPSPGLSWSLAGEYEARRYFKLGSENTNNYAFQGGLSYRVGGGTVVTVKGLQARNSEPRTSPDSLTGIARPNRFDITEGYADVIHNFNRVSIRGTLDYQRRNYFDNSDSLGNVIDQNFRDRSTVTGNLIAQYAISPNLAVFAAGSANERNYRTRIGPIPARDSNGYEIALGSSFNVGHLMQGTMRLGYLQQNYKDPIFKDVQGFLIRGELAYYVTPLVTLTAKVDRRVVETGVIDAAGYTRTTASLQADYELLRNLILHLEAGTEHRNFVGIERTDDRFTGELSATWLLSPRWSMRMDLSHRGQDSAGIFSGRKFSETAASIGIVFKGL